MFAELKWPNSIHSNATGKSYHFWNMKIVIMQFHTNKYDTGMGNGVFILTTVIIDQYTKIPNEISNFMPSFIAVDSTPYSKNVMVS